MTNTNTNYTTKKDFIYDIMPPARPSAAEPEQAEVTYAYRPAPASTSTSASTPASMSETRVYTREQMRDYRRHERREKIRNIIESIREWYVLR